MEEPYSAASAASASASAASADASPTSESTSESNFKPGKSKVPVTIVAGFLGSGKTTLLQHLLNSPQDLGGRRIAVIENEYGEGVGVERLVAKNEQGDDTSTDMDELFVELSNGCVCCSVKDDLVTTLEAMLQRRSKFDCIVVECSGMADPGALASIFWLDEELESDLYLDAIITVVDCKNLEKHLREDPSIVQKSGTSKGSDYGNEVMNQNDWLNECYLQIAHADRILLNKRDLVSEDDLLNIRQRVESINPLAQMTETVYSKAELSFLLDVEAFDPSQAVLRMNELRDGDHAHTHSSDVQAIVVHCKSSLDLAKLRLWLGELLWESEAERIYRIKGVIAVKDATVLYVLQAVHETFEIEPSKKATTSTNAATDSSDSAFVGKIVFIGKGLDEAKLRSGILSLQDSI